MFNPLDMLQAQNGAGMQSVAQQFGLTPEQTRRAMEALMPAFALGMQRSPPPDPTGLSQFFGMAGARPAASLSASPAETMLGQMFGSPALTQAILQQASSASGVGSQVLRQMLPVMAGAVVASIVHMLLNQQAPEKVAPAAAPSPFAAQPVWAEMMKAFLPAEAAPEKPNPQAARPPVAKPAPEPAGTGMFQQMLKTGAEVQEQNVKAMQGLFESFWTEADPSKARSSKAEAPSDPAAAPAAPVTDVAYGSQKPRKGRTPMR